MRYVQQERGAHCIGLTLSQGQAAACRKNGLEVFVKDCRNVKPEDFGLFDAVSSVGAFEHFCSIEDWKQGKQEKIYSDFFKSIHNLLPDKGRSYIQTMTFSKNMIPFEEVSIDAPHRSPAHVMALMIKQFPGSWLPYGSEMVEQCAAPYFKLISKSSGRLDYIETIGQWRKRFRKFHFKKYLLYLSLVPNYFIDPEFKHRVDVFRMSPNRICFELEIMDHFRMVFEKV